MTMRNQNNKSALCWMQRRIRQTGLCLLACLAVTPVFAMQALSNNQMASISGKDGVNINLSTSKLSAQSLGLRMNAADPNLRGGLEIQNITYTPVDKYGNDMTGIFKGELALGIDLGQSFNGVPAGVISLNLPKRVRFHTDNVMLFGNGSAANDATSKAGSFGEVAYDASAKVVFSNVGGLFNADGENFMLYGKLDDASLFWRQQSGDPTAPYLVMTDGKTFWHAYNAHIGVDKNGLVQTADLIDLGLEYTTRFKQPDPSATDPRMTLCTAGTACTATATDPGIGMFRFGWEGTIVDPYLLFAGGGIAQDTTGAYSTQGLHLIAKWNFLSNDGSASNHFGQHWDAGTQTYVDGPDANGNYFAKSVTTANFDPSGNNQDNKHTGFHWFLGNETDPNSNTTPVSFELANWRNLPGAKYGSVMDIRTSVVHAGYGAANALCFGSRDCVNPDGTHNNSEFGEVVNIAPSAIGLGLTIRDSSIRAYSESIRANDTHFPNTVPSGVQDFDWGLINTFSHMDANIYLYPHQSTVANVGNEIIADIVVMGQTLDDDNGSFRHTTGTGNRLDANGNRASNFGRGSHMLIADTKAGNGIGMMNMSFLLMARQTHIIMKPMTSSNDPAGQYDPANYVSSANATAEEAYRGGLDFTSPEVRYNLYATFGGLDLAPVGKTNPYTYYPAFGEACPSGETCPAQLVGGINSWNYEGFFNFRLSPHPASLTGNANKQYLGYSLVYRATSYNVKDDSGNLLTVPSWSPAYGLIGAPPSGSCESPGICSGKGTYFGTAEPHQQDALVTTGAVTGDMAFVNGKLMITAGKEVMNGGVIDYNKSEMPSLSFSHDILMGMSAYNEVRNRAAILGGVENIPGGKGARPFMINRMEFNGQNLGSIVVPKGRYYGTAALSPQRL